MNTKQQALQGLDKLEKSLRLKTAKIRDLRQVVMRQGQIIREHVIRNTHLVDANVNLRVECMDLKARIFELEKSQ